METKKSNRTRNLSVRFTEREYDILQERFKNTTCRKLSDYIRKLLFGKPITTYTRDKSMDDFTQELLELKTELNRIGNNYNQVVQKMHTLNSIPEFQNWQRMHDTFFPILFSRIGAIQSFIDKIGVKWLQ